MTTGIRSGSRISLALAVASLAVACGARAAEPMTEVLVEAPKLVRTGERAPPIGAPIDIAAVTYRVSYADLNLATSAGAKTLEERVTEAAQRACKQLENAAGPNALSVPGDPPCLKTAVDAAMKKAREAIAAAESKARR
jgi:UrcA family protein